MSVLNPLRQFTPEKTFNPLSVEARSERLEEFGRRDMPNNIFSLKIGFVINELRLFLSDLYPAIYWMKDQSSKSVVRGLYHTTSTRATMISLLVL